MAVFFFQRSDEAGASHILPIMYIDSKVRTGHHNFRMLALLTLEHDPLFLWAPMTAWSWMKPDLAHSAAPYSFVSHSVIG
jgi:hypothetical protein